ncbi:MAG: glutaredoxin, partial [Rubrivivax sp.]
VGMKGNPFPKKARQLLDRAGIAHHDLEYGGYMSLWRRRNALKMWTGWPTFRMVFVRGTLVGGAQDLQALIASGELKRLLAP